MKATLIKNRDEEDEMRKLAKREHDKVFTLAVHKDGKTYRLATTTDDTKMITGEKVRLLDEGTIVMADGSPDFIIMKGTIKKWYDNLSEDFVGTINKAHVDFRSDPLLYGEWTKKDLTIVGIGDGRVGVDVIPHYYDISAVKDLQAMPYTIGISSEFRAYLNVEATEEYGIEHYDEIELTAFALVGQAGNVNSGGVKLSTEETKEVKNMALETVKKALEVFNKTKQEVEETEEVAEEVTEEVKDKEKESEEETEDVAEEVTEDINELLEEALSVIENKDKEIAELNDAVKDLTEKFEQLSVKVEKRNKDITATADHLTDVIKKNKAEADKKKEHMNNHMKTKQLSTMLGGYGLLGGVIDAE